MRSARAEHYPVLLAETMEFLAVRPFGVYVDVTTGLGGHTRAIAERLGTGLDRGLLLAGDRDAESLELARASLGDWSQRIRFFHGKFSRLVEMLDEANISTIDGLVADLGVSRYQLTAGERGFSINEDGPLDMRMDRSCGTTAAELVNTLPETALANLLFELGEERRSRRISRAIVRARPITTTGQLAAVVRSAVPRATNTGDRRKKAIHPATQTFMALRLRVNGELEDLQSLLDVAPQRLAPGGRMVVLTFMSLEDRIVKRAFQGLARNGVVRLLNKHVVTPAREEVLANAASRSAKLRAVERI